MGVSRGLPISLILEGLWSGHIHNKHNKPIRGHPAGTGAEPTEYTLEFP